MTNETFGNHKKSLRLKFINMKTLLFFFEIETKLTSVMFEPMLCLLLNLSNQPCEILKLYLFLKFVGIICKLYKKQLMKD